MKEYKDPFILRTYTIGPLHDPVTWHGKNYTGTQIGHVRYINILTWLRGFRVKILYLVLFSLYPSLFWELRNKRSLKNLQFWPESLGAMLEYWYIERGLLRSGTFKTKESRANWYEFLCFGSCVPVWFIPYHVTGSCKGPIQLRLFIPNMPFATNDHMEQNLSCWGQANYYSRTGTLKQRQVKLDWLRSLCFNVPVRE